MSISYDKRAENDVIIDIDYILNKKNGFYKEDKKPKIRCETTGMIIQQVCYKEEGNNPALKTKYLISEKLLSILIEMIFTSKIILFLLVGIALISLNFYSFPIFLIVKYENEINISFMITLMPMVCGLILILVFLVLCYKRINKKLFFEEKNELMLLILKFLFVVLNIVFNIAYIEINWIVIQLAITITIILFEIIVFYELIKRIKLIKNSYIKIEIFTCNLLHTVARLIFLLFNLFQLNPFLKLIMINFHIWNYLAEIKIHYRKKYCILFLCIFYCLGCFVISLNICNYCWKFIFLVPYCYLIKFLKKLSIEAYKIVKINKRWKNGCIYEL
ncbi:hypothetical protein GVAV_003253 [Gurleya vavrai]